MDPYTLNKSPTYLRLYKEEQDTNSYTNSPIFGYSEGETKRRILASNYRAYALGHINPHAQNTIQTKHRAISFYDETRTRFKYSDFQFIEGIRTQHNDSLNDRYIANDRYTATETSTPVKHYYSKARYLKREDGLSKIKLRPLTDNISTKHMEIVMNLNKFEERINNLGKIL